MMSKPPYLWDYAIFWTYFILTAPVAIWFVVDVWNY